MNAFTPVAPRLAKLLPMLSSSHDGEKLATLAAISRALESANLSWHDFAAHLSAESQIEEASPRFTNLDLNGPTHAIARWCINNQAGELNAVEGDFLRRFACNPHWTATPKQRAWLVQIALKIGA
ncbi:hypothetical protein [Aquidulcibacter sp.]|uniref:hypothetical protein n=1 Tax=Aquidulcibacter sp. TaxID=2052990 RepID=UPI003BA65A9F